MTTRTLRLHQVIVSDHIHRLDIDQDAIKDLAASIEQHGLINPITVIDNGDDTYTLRAGHCRLLAHQHLNRTTIEATVRNGSVRDTEGITFAENLHRTELTPMEQAYAIKHEHDDNLVPVETIARVLHRSTEWIKQRLALVAMPHEMKELVHTSALPIASALLLATITDDTHRNYLVRYAVDAGAAVPVIREWVRQWHVAQALGTPDNAPLPEMPAPGAPVVVMMPCSICGEAHPYQQLRVMRTCNDCTQRLNTAVYQEPATA
jgi:ParB family chromosome partitioning protein